MLASMPTTRTRRRAPNRGTGVVQPPDAPRIDSDRPTTRAVTTTGLVPLSTRIPPEIKKRLKLLAVENDVSEQQAVAEALQEWIARRQPR